MKLITLFSIVLLCNVLNAQNLVVNFDFEDYNLLPDDQSQWDRCNDWINPAVNASTIFYGNPDYFHSNGSGLVQLPNSAIAQIQPYSGDAIMGIVAYEESETDAREYIMNQLVEPMVAGQFYEVILQVNNGDANQGHTFGVDNLGVHFSVDPIPNQTSYTVINRTPQAYVDSILWVDEWTEIKFIIQADSAFEYITIGNFFSDSQTNKLLINNGPSPLQGAYYFLDDIVVQRINSSSVSENYLNNFTVYPNPASDFLRIQLEERHDQELSAILMDATGKIVLNKHIETHGEPFFEIDVTEFARGFYTLVLRSAHGNSSQKIMLK